jgi:zinc-ribbon domain
MALLKRLRRKGAHPEANAGTVPRRRHLPPPSQLRRERRALLYQHEQRVRDLGGLVLEMYRQDSFRQDVLHEQAAEIVSLEERIREVDRLLSARSSRSAPRVRCPSCGSPQYAGARFCASCGQPLAAPAAQ